MSEQHDDKDGGKGLALPLRVIRIGGADSKFQLGWCAIDANDRVIGSCLTEAQANQLVAPFAVSSIGASEQEPCAWRYRYGKTGMWKYADKQEDINPAPEYEREPLYPMPWAVSAIEALAAKLNEADAARYRWLNGHYELQLRLNVEDPGQKDVVYLKCGKPLDAWIDQRIAEGNEPVRSGRADDRAEKR